MLPPTAPIALVWRFRKRPEGPLGTHFMDSRVRRFFSAAQLWPSYRWCVVSTAALLLPPLYPTPLRVVLAPLFLFIVPSLPISIGYSPLHKFNVFWRPKQTVGINEKNAATIVTSRWVG